MQAARLHRTVGVKVGRFQVGGGAPVVVQSMTMTDTADARATAQQVVELAEAGSEMVRVTVNLPEAAAAVPEIKQRMLDAGCTVPLIGDFHYNGHLLLTRYPACAAALEQVPHQSRERRHRTPARRAVHDHLQGGRRPRQTGAHRRQWRLSQPGARHAADAGQHGQKPRAHVRADPECLHGAVGASVDRAGAGGGPPARPDHHLVQGIAAARSGRYLPRPRAKDGAAAASRASPRPAWG